MSNISSISSSSNPSRPSDAWKAGNWEAGGPKVGKKRPRAAAGAPEKDPDVDNNSLGDLPVDEVQFEKTEMKKDPIANATIDDVVFTQQPINPHKRINPKKPRSDKDFTRLVSVGSIEVSKLMSDDLKRFATRVGMEGHRNFNKRKVCEAIVEFKINPVASQKKKEAKKKKAVVINRKRFINVLFDEVFLPKLSTRGQSLNKDQLTDGLKTDELLFRDFIVLYNNKEDFNDDEHPHLEVKGDPSDFTPISWEAARKFFRELMRDYDVCVANWKRSGNHGSFAENQKKPFADFRKNRGDMLYLHEFAHQVPDVLKHVLTQLNADTFHESISDDEVGTTTGSQLAKLATSSKKKKKPTPRKNSSGDNIAAAILALSNDAKDRNKVQKYALFVEMENNTTKIVREHKAEWKKVVADASKKKNKARSFIKQEYCKYKANKDNPPKRTEVDEILAGLSDSDVSGRQPQQQPLSQQSNDDLESVFEDLYEIDKDIEKAQRRLAHFETQANDLANELKNDKENVSGNVGD